jgi:protein gp37
MGLTKYQRDGDSQTSGSGFGLTMHEDVLSIPKKWSTPRTIFVNSMSDLFHVGVTDAFIHRVFEMMASTPQHTYQILTKRSKRLAEIASDLPWPHNVWIGVSIESDSYAFRADHLRTVDAAVRFLSLEPLLGPLPSLSLEGIGWVIAGGESGIGSRAPEADWFRDIRDRCEDADTPFFFKQWGGRTPKAGGRVLDDRTWDELPPSAVSATDQEYGRRVG